MSADSGKELRLNEGDAEKKGFREWALVELMGHQRIVGFVSEQTIGGAAMLRVDVPDAEGATRFTRLYGSSAIYAINPVSKEVALKLAGAVDAEPVKAWQLPAPSAPAGASGENLGDLNLGDLDAGEEFEP